MISRPDLFLAPGINILENNELRDLIVSGEKLYGSLKTASLTLQWPLTQMQAIQSSQASVRYPGPPVLSLSLNDIKGLSLLRTRKKIRQALINALRHLGSGREIGLFLGVKECFVRRNDPKTKEAANALPVDRCS